MQEEKPKKALKKQKPMQAADEMQEEPKKVVKSAPTQ